MTIEISEEEFKELECMSIEDAENILLPQEETV